MPRKTDKKKQPNYDDNDNNNDNDSKEAKDYSDEYSDTQHKKSKGKKEVNLQKSKMKLKNKKMQPKNLDDDGDDDDDDDVNVEIKADQPTLSPVGNENEAEVLRKVPIKLDSKFKVPLCYAIFFEQLLLEKPKSVKLDEPINRQNEKLEIKVEAGKYKNRFKTNLKWSNKKLFTDKELDTIREHAQTEFSTNCNTSPLFLSMGGRFAKELKKYLVDEFHFLEENITVKDINWKIPKQFNIKISIDENKDNIAEVTFYYKYWNCPLFYEFVDNFKRTMTKEWNFTIEKEFDHKMKKSLIVKGDNFNNVFNDFFIKVNKIDKSNIRRKTKSVLSSYYSRTNTYQEMKKRFAEFSPTSYFHEMSETIRDAYKYDREKLKDFIIHTNLDFSFSFDDEEGNCFWYSFLNVLNICNFDDTKTSQTISEGNLVIVKYKKTGATIIGMIEKIYTNGYATVSFKLSKNQIPPGSRSQLHYYYPNFDFSQYTEANLNQSNQYQLEDDDNFDIISDSQGDGNYVVSFQPNGGVYKKSSAALLVLNEIENPIKDIIIREEKTIDESLNKVNNDTITETSFDLRNLPTVEEYKDNPNILKYLQLTPTQSQIDCMNSILQNRISLIQGPPGCGKTTSIGFFVYHLLNQNNESQKKILLCAYSNQAVENIVKFVSPIVKALGKKMVWIPNQLMFFESEKDFKNASEVEKNLSYYKILTDDKLECNEFRQLQYQKWRYEEEMSRFIEARNNNQYYVFDTNASFTQKQRERMNQIQLKVESKFVSESDVVCCTLLQSAKSSVANYKFEYLFIDEATQVDQINSLIPLIHRPSKMILLGDHKQLDPFVSQQMKEAHPFTTQSLYLYLISKNLNHSMLKTQFRMNPLIAEFPNREFYDNQIESASNMEEKTKILLRGIKTPIAFVDVKNGKEQRAYGSSYINKLEADAVVKILHNIQMNNISGSEVGVITPYYGQKELLRNQTAKMNYNGLRISSVDTFQGSERDFIILSLVRANKNGNFGFLTNQNRINVSITRARKGLIIVGNFDSIVNSNNDKRNPKNQFLVNLCKFYEENNAVVDVNSIPYITRAQNPPIPVSSIVYNHDQEIVDDDYECDDDNDDDYFQQNK